MLANLMVLLSIANPCLDQYSVATVRRSYALGINPAGLAVNPGVELSYRFGKAEEVWSHDQNLLLGNIGLGLATVDGATEFRAGIGLTPVKKTLHLGYGYESGDAGGHSIGTILRPGRFMSIGLETRIGDPTKVRGGLALRPLTDRVTVSGDAIYEQDSIRWQFGGEVEALPGLTISGQSDLSGNFRAGVEISLGRLKVGGSAGEAVQSGRVLVSNQRYPSLRGEGKKFVKMELAGRYDEDRQERQLISLFLKREPAFYNLMSGLKEVREDRSVQALFLRLGDYTLSSAQYDELAQELAKLKAANKKLVIFSHSYKSLVEYRIVSLADYLILAELGEVVIPGVWARKFYLKGSLDRLGIETDIEHIGAYKSAQELLSRKDMSEADSIQWEAILDDIYEPAVTEAAAHRKLPRDEFERLISEKGYYNSDDARNAGLVDTTAFFYEVDDVVKKRIGGGLKPSTVTDLKKSKPLARAWRECKAKVALVIAEGSIVMGKSGYDPTPFIGGKVIGSETVAKTFEKLRKDKSVKAVVFRVNSGGGSALASDIICEAVGKCDKEKPVIVSMGGVAGSGGYYVACLARKIVADPTTITGSIGVLGVKLVTRRFYDEKLGMTWDWIKRGEHADAYGDLRHLTEPERVQYREEVKWYYGKFLARVASGRKLTRQFVDSVGQGRIWSGRKAKELGLIDEVGGLLDAIELAKKEAGIKGEVDILVYPKAERKLVSGLGLQTHLLELLAERWLYIMPCNVEVE